MFLTASKYSKASASRGSNASQTLEDVSWDKHTFKLPIKLTNAATAHPSTKDRYYRATLEGVDAANHASSLTKLNLLSSQFEFPHLKHEVNGSLKSLYDNTTGTENSLIVTQNPLVFTFSRPCMRDEQGKPVRFSNPGARGGLAYIGIQLNSAHSS